MKTRLEIFEKEVREIITKTFKSNSEEVCNVFVGGYYTSFDWNKENKALVAIELRFFGGQSKHTNLYVVDKTKGIVSGAYNSDGKACNERDLLIDTIELAEYTLSFLESTGARIGISARLNQLKEIR